MADNVTIPATGSGTATPAIATDDVSSVHYQKIKVDAGGDGLSVPLVAGAQTMAASFPVVIASNQTAVPVSAASLPLPTGAATLAEQQTQTTSLATLNTTLGSPFQAGGSIGNTAFTANAGTNLNTSALATAAKQPALGTAGVSSTDVISVQGIASGTALPISGTVTATVTGVATEAKQDTQITALQLIDNAVSGAGFNITQFAGVNAASGSGTATGAVRVELPTNGTGVIATVTAVTAITNALPAGTNAIGKLAANNGVDIGDVDVTSIAAGANIIGKVGLDQTTPGTTNAVSVPALAVAAAVTSVADAATSTQLLASTATRKGYKLYNDSTAIAYVKEGTTASTTDYSYKLYPEDFYESVGLGCYTGKIDCIWASDASGAMKVTEVS